MKSIESLRNEVKQWSTGKGKGSEHFAVLSAAIDELSTLREQLDSYKEQWRRHYETLGRELQAQTERERQEWFVSHLNHERDDAVESLKAEITTLKAQRDRAELHQKTAVEAAHSVQADCETALLEMAKTEREACARLAEDFDAEEFASRFYLVIQCAAATADEIAAAIRARGQP